ncbi:MAG: hypothetical protein ACYT04_59590, partial [Nostoc sp.]
MNSSNQEISHKLGLMRKALSETGAMGIRLRGSDWFSHVHSIEPQAFYLCLPPMIEAVGAKVIYLSSYSPDFYPIELWWSQLKSFLRSFAPTTTEMVDKLISVALDLINPQHLR